MSFEKFIPEVWSAKFMDDLDMTLVFKENCNHDYEGDAKQAGDAVRILGVGEIETGRWTDGKLHQLPTPQDPENNTQVLPINQVEYFNFSVDDLDKAQAQGGSGLLSKYQAKAKDAVAEKIDAYIAGLHLNNSLTYDEYKSTAVTATTILDAIDRAYLLLLEQNVSRSSKVTLTAPPKFIMLLKRAYVELDTDNSDMIKNGRVGRYSGIELKESNNVSVDSSGIYHIQLKTDDAIAFVNPYTHMEACRPTDYFKDVVKGYSLFDGKVIAPKQVVDMQIKLS